MLRFVKIIGIFILFFFLIKYSRIFICILQDSASKIMAPKNYGLSSAKMLLPLLFVPPTPLPLAFSCTHARAHTLTYSQTRIHRHIAPRASPLITHPCHLHRHRLLRSAEWPKVGEPLLAAHAINSLPHLLNGLGAPAAPLGALTPSYWLLRRGWVGARAGGGPLYRPGQLYYCSFINFQFSLMMLWAGFTLLIEKESSVCVGK